MVLVNHEKFGRSQAALDFLVRRAIRIVPLYWLMSALMVLLLVFLPQAFGTLTFRLGQAIESFLFIPTTSSAGEFVPVLAVGWTLSYEVLFYVAFAAMLPTSLRSSLALTGVVFGIAAGIGYLRTSTGPLDSMLFSDLLLEFVLGECLALRILRRAALAPRTSRLLLALALTVFVAHVFIGDLGVARLLSTGLPAAALVLALVSLDWRERLRLPAWLRRVGDESYSLYLSHLITNSVFFKLCVATRVDRFVPVDVLIPLAVLNAVGWGHLLHRWVERPMTQRLTRAWQRVLRDLRERAMQVVG